MSDIASSVAAELARLGRPMTLRRRIGTTASFTSVTVNGVDRSYQPGEVMGAIEQGDAQVTIGGSEIAAAAWPGPPRRLDTILIDGQAWTVQGADSKTIGSTLIAYVLHVRGG